MIEQMKKNLSEGKKYSILETSSTTNCEHLYVASKRILDVSKGYAIESFHRDHEREHNFTGLGINRFTSLPELIKEMRAISSLENWH